MRTLLGWDHVIRDERDLKNHVDYIHNPVKHGYVKRAIDWPHSTFHRYLAERVYTPDWGTVPMTSANPTTPANEVGAPQFIGAPGG